MIKLKFRRLNSLKESRRVSADLGGSRRFSPVSASLGGSRRISAFFRRSRRVSADLGGSRRFSGGFSASLGGSRRLTALFMQVSASLGGSRCSGFETSLGGSPLRNFEIFQKWDLEILDVIFNL